MTSDIKKVIKEIETADTIGLMTHVNGDGDAFGSLLGLRNILESLGKKVVLFSNESLPDYLAYLKKEARYKPTARYKKVDLLVGLDLPSVKRFTVPAIFEKARSLGVRTLIVDHHTDGDLHRVVDAVWQKTDISSTSEMVYWLAMEMRAKLSKTTAQLLLWGIETDTYFLSNPNVFESTHTARKTLWGLGAITEEIKDNVRLTSPTSDEEFMYLVMNRLLECSPNIIFTYVTAADKKRFKIQIPVSSAVANYLDYNRKPGVAVVAEQRTPKIVKISMRSNHSDIDVAKVAKMYGGGGHVGAAGFEIEGKVGDFMKSDEFNKLIKRLAA